MFDPSSETRDTLHKLEDLLMIVFSAAVGGIKDWVGMEEFGKQKRDWLKSFRDLTNGIPSHDTLSDRIDRLEQKPRWAGLQALGRVESTRIVGEHTSTEYRDYLCSLTDPADFAKAVRRHRDIENGQHWVLDVQFGGNANRARKDHSAENLALIRRMALNVIRRNGPSKDSLRRRKLRASLNDEYRAQLIFGARTT
jgi:predicted transposase YbfD/YdcC